jgi:hypothetical protein
LPWLDSQELFFEGSYFPETLSKIQCQGILVRSCNMWKLWWQVVPLLSWWLQGNFQTGCYQISLCQETSAGLQQSMHLWLNKLTSWASW